MKKKRKGTYYAKGSGTGGINPIRSHGAAQSGYSIEEPSYGKKKVEKADKEKQKKFLAALGGAFKKKKEVEAEERRIKEAQIRRIKEAEGKLKEMPKMIVPDLGPDFRHEVKFEQSEEQKMKDLRKMSWKKWK